MCSTSPGDAGPRTHRFWTALGLAVLAVLAMRVGLSLAAVGNAVMSGRDTDDVGVSLFIAVVCTAVVVPVVLFLRRRVDRRDLRSMGLDRAGPALRRTVGAFAVTVVVAGVVLAPATAAGAIVWEPVDAVQLLYFLVVNAVIALLLEALPEEIVFRGYVFTVLAETGRRVLAVVLTTVLFVAMPTLGSSADDLARLVFGLPPEPGGIAPPGEDPASYVILLTVVGVALIAVRLASGSIWPCVGLHLGFLTVNRVVLGVGPADPGVRADLVDTDAILLLLLYPVLAAVALVAIARSGPRPRRPASTPPDAATPSRWRR